MMTFTPFNDGCMGIARKLFLYLMVVPAIGYGNFVSLRSPPGGCVQAGGEEPSPVVGEGEVADAGRVAAEPTDNSTE